jgi:hypothetical protein
MIAEFASAMAGAGSAHQAANASREETSQQRAGRSRRASTDPRRAQQGATDATAAAPAALDSLSRLQQLADASPQVAQLRRLQALADGQFAPVAQLAGGPEEEELVQGQFATAQLQPQLQQAPRANNTGLPDQLKSGIESLSGLSMDHVRVHYNSSQPAQLNALAYAQGSDIHLGPGQERHLPHEAWHVVQQAQGRVRPTMQMKDRVTVNDDVGLEREADVMGTKALEGGDRVDETHRSVSLPIETAQRKAVAATHNGPQTASLATVQCFKKVGTGDYDLEEVSDTDYFFKTQSVDPELIKKKRKEYRAAHAITRTNDKQGLLVSEDNTLAINDTQEQAKEFYGAAGIVGSSNAALEAAKSKVRLKESGELSLRHSGGTLKKITPTPDEETVQGAAEGFAKLGSHICIEMASSVMGSGLHEAVFQQPDSKDETVVNISSGNDAGDPMINTLGEEFVNSPPQVNTGDVRTNMLNKPSPALPGESYGKYARTKKGRRKARQMGINEYASPKVGEGYATYSLAASETKQIDYLQTGSAREALQSIWGYHYAAVVAKSNDGKDTVTLENYNRTDDIYKLLVEVMKRQIAANANKFKDTLDEVTPVDGDQRPDTQRKLMRVLEVARGISPDDAQSAFLQIANSYAASESWFFKMQSQKKGQSFHEQQAASGAFVNPLTLRVRPQDDIREGERTTQLKLFNAIPKLPTRIAGLPAFEGMADEMAKITKDIQQAETVEDIGVKAPIARGAAITAILKRILTAIMEERASTGSPSLSKAMEHFNGAGSVALKASLVENEGRNAYSAIKKRIQSLWIFNVEQHMAYSMSQTLVVDAMEYAKSLGAFASIERSSL